MMADLLAGQIQMAIETSASAAPHVRSGKVRALAVTTRTRSRAFPDLPPMEEAGLKGYEVTTWYGLVAPRGTPQPVIDRLYRDVQRILQSPEMLKRFTEIGAEPGGEPPQQFAEFIHRESVKWARVVKDSGASAE